MLVLLCHPTDIAPAAGARQRWVDFFAADGADPSNICRYLTDMSQGRYDTTTVVTEWLDVGHTSAEAAQHGGQAQRQVLAGWARATASFDLSGHGPVVFGYNMNADHGSVGSGQAVLAYADDRPFEPTFMFHEVGHALGLDHSWSQDDGVYGDRFDIMSAMNVWTFPDGWARAAGPAATAINLEKLRWLDLDRVYYANFEDIASREKLVLAPLHRPDTGGDNRRAAVYLHQGTETSYYLEYREATGWDAGFPGPRVLIHRIDGEGRPVMIGGGWEPAGALPLDGSINLPFERPCPIGIRFESIDASGAAVIGISLLYM